MKVASLDSLFPINWSGDDSTHQGLLVLPWAAKMSFTTSKCLGSRQTSLEPPPIRNYNPDLALTSGTTYPIPWDRISGTQREGEVWNVIPNRWRFQRSLSRPQEFRSSEGHLPLLMEEREVLGELSHLHFRLWEISYLKRQPSSKV